MSEFVRDFPVNYSGSNTLVHMEMTPQLRGDAVETAGRNSGSDDISRWVVAVRMKAEEVRSTTR
jgi:hypothetical protein